MIDIAIAPSVWPVSRAVPCMAPARTAARLGRRQQQDAVVRGLEEAEAEAGDHRADDEGHPVGIGRHDAHDQARPIARSAPPAAQSQAVFTRSASRPDIGAITATAAGHGIM